MKRRKLIQTGLIAILGVASLSDVAWAQAKPTEPNEELMNDHGILRRALLVCHHCASLLREGKVQNIGKPLHETAIVFQRFGGDYHEKAIEETFVFPEVLKGDPATARCPTVLIRQHERSREFLTYLQDITKSGIVPARNAGQLASQLEVFDKMYRFHAAYEDTVVFPAWKNQLSAQAYGEMRERFVQVQQKMIGSRKTANSLVAFQSAPRLQYHASPAVRGRREQRLG
jgi:hemerythrin-like domain-containing protein